MYEKITAVDPYNNPMMIYPAIHYSMGGLWVDYNLMTTIPGLYAIGECNFSDHGANRLGASALMQGLADGYFILPYTSATIWPKKSRLRKSIPIPRNSTKLKNMSPTVCVVCMTSKERNLRIISIKNWDTSCGNTSVWPVKLPV